MHGASKLGGSLSIQQARRSIFERAIRAVCQMIVRYGEAVFPLRMSQGKNGTHLSAKNLFGLPAASNRFRHDPN